MALETASLERLARALAETYYALNEVIQVLQRFPSIPTSFSQRNLNDTDGIIPHDDFKAYYEREQHQRYNFLDQRYGELLPREIELKRAYPNPRNADQYDLLLSQLDAVQQEMTEILGQLS